MKRAKRRSILVIFAKLAQQRSFRSRLTGGIVARLQGVLDVRSTP